ncbi:MAG: hypothetical protein KGL39_30045 [Patescibacteria group bacterium]|nr:hypothetical protein [Patescibacteria group bacterium]
MTKTPTSNVVRVDFDQDHPDKELLGRIQQLREDIAKAHGKTLDPGESVQVEDPPKHEASEFDPPKRKRDRAEPKEPKSNIPVVTVKELADELKISAKQLRKILRKQESVGKAGGRWEWPVGSKELQAIKELATGRTQTAVSKK